MLRKQSSHRCTMFGLRRRAKLVEETQRCKTSRLSTAKAVTAGEQSGPWTSLWLLGSKIKLQGHKFCKIQALQLPLELTNLQGTPKRRHVSLLSSSPQLRIFSTHRSSAQQTTQPSTSEAQPEERAKGAAKEDTLDGSKGHETLREASGHEVTSKNKNNPIQ